jgi:hypothetical protein
MEPPQRRRQSALCGLSAEVLQDSFFVRRKDSVRGTDFGAVFVGLINEGVRRGETTGARTTTLSLSTTTTTVGVRTRWGRRW